MILQLYEVCEANRPTKRSISCSISEFVNNQRSSKGRKGKALKQTHSTLTPLEQRQAPNRCDRQQDRKRTHLNVCAEK